MITFLMITHMQHVANMSITLKGMPNAKALLMMPSSSISLGEYVPFVANTSVVEDILISDFKLST